MINLRSLFSRWRTADPGDTSGFALPTRPNSDIEGEYEAIIWTQLARAEIPSSCVSVEVHAVPRRGQVKLPEFVGMLRLTGWSKTAALRLLVGLPLLESKTRLAAENTWLVDVSEFGGLWLRASGELQTHEVLRELRQAVAQLETPHSDPATIPDRLWSLPQDLEGR